MCTHPELSLEWDYVVNRDLTPSQINATSHKKVGWICRKCRYKWKALVFSRTRGAGCPACAGKVVVPGINDLATLSPELALEWDYEANGDLTPSAVTAHSGKVVGWICQICKYKWRATVASRSKGAGCPACAGQVALPGFNDLATLNPELALEWDYEANGDLTPSAVTAHSGKKVGWFCKKCGYKWKATILNRSNGSGCPACAGKVVVSGMNDLATINPELALEWDYEANGDLKPTMVTANSHKKVGWICRKCDHRWRVAIHVRNKGNGCPACAGKVVVPGINDLATLNPELALEWDYEANGDLTPSAVTANSNKAVGWICRKCDHRWKAIIYARNQGNGCPECGKRKRAETRRLNNARKIKEKTISDAQTPEQ